MGIKDSIRKFIHGDHESATGKAIKETASMMRETVELTTWEQGRNPNLKVNITIDSDYGHIHASYGKHASACLGTETDVLERIGYKIFVWHRRDYLDVPTGAIKRLRPRQVKGEIATGGVYIYGPNATAGQVQPVKFSTEPLATGGDTRVRVMAPSGHWAEGEAVCATDDVFDKAAGRSLALSRAFEKLNETVNG